MKNRSGGTWRSFTTAALLLALPSALYAQNSEPEVDTTLNEVSPELQELLTDEAFKELTPQEQLNFILEKYQAEQGQAIRELDAVDFNDVPAPRLRGDAIEEARPVPANQPAPAAVEDHLSREEKRQQAEALIAELAGADEPRIAEIEEELAALGEVALVPLKLAALGDDFELRSRAGAMARRLRWRLACSAALLAQLPHLPSVMASEEQLARRELVDDLIALGGRGAIGLFNECLADRDRYIRERGIDGLVAVGQAGNTQGAVDALEHAALHVSDDSVVLLAVAGLGELGSVDIAVLTELFEKTKSAEVQRTVLLTAGYSRQPEAVDLIARALKDPRWRVRAAGLEALEDIKSNADKTRMGELVMPLLADPEPFIAATALRLVTELELPGAAGIVYQQIESGAMSLPAGLEILAGIEDPRARRMILEQYGTANQASDHEEANRWLAMLRGYGDDAEVGRLVEQVLGDEARRPQWKTALMLSTYFTDTPRIAAMVSGLLMDADAETRRSAWEVIEYSGMFRNQPIGDALDRQLAAGDPEQRRWRLDAHYMNYNGDPTAVLADALADPEAQVVNRALAMLGQIKIKYDLGITDLPYRPERSQYEFEDADFAPDGTLRPRQPDQAPDEDPLLNPGPDNPLVVLLDHEDIPARTRAATLLYITGKHRGETVVAVLRSALQSDLPELQTLALKAATAEPGKLVEGVDVAALMTSGLPPIGVQAAAIVVLQTTGDVDAVAQVIGDIDFYNGTDFFITLAQTNNDKALDLLKTRVRTDDSYRVRHFMEQLVAADIAAAAALMADFSSNPQTDDWDLESVMRVVMRSSDPAVIPVLEAELERRRGSNNSRYQRDYMTQQIEQRLIALDPERATKMIGTKLAGSMTEQREAIAMLVDMPPSEPLADLVFAAIQARPAPAAEEWSQVATWLMGPDAQPFRQRFVDVIGELPGPMQDRMLEFTIIHAGDKDFGMSLDALLAVTPNSPAARARVEMMVAQYTTTHPAARPADAAALQAQSDQAKAYLLSAAGQWGGSAAIPGGDSEALLRPYLDSDNADLAAAALRGLAVHLLLIESPELTDADTERFAAAVTHDDEFTAYLAAEVLYQFAPQRLLKLDAGDITSAPALLRYAAAADQRLGGPADQALITALRENQDANNTLLRLALIASVNQAQPRIFRIVGEQALASHGDQLRRMALEQQQFQEFVQAVQLGLITPDEDGVDELVDLTTRRLLGRGDARLGPLITQGFIDHIATEDLPDYLDAMSRYSAQGYWGSPLDHLLPLIDAGDPGLRDTLESATESGADGKMLATMLLWHYFQDPDALEAMLNQALARRDTDSWSTTNMNAALLSFLAEADAPEIAARMRAGLEASTGDDWSARSLRQQLLWNLAAIDPDAARDYLKALTPEQWQQMLNDQHDESWAVVYDQLNLMAIDQADYDQRRVTPGESSFTELFEELRAQQEPVDALVMKGPPWGYAWPLAQRDTDHDDWQAQLRATVDRIGGADWADIEFRDPYAEAADDPASVGQALAWYLPRPAATPYLPYGDEYHGADYLWLRHRGAFIAPRVHYLYPGLAPMGIAAHADPAAVAQALGPLLDREEYFVAGPAIRAVVDWKAKSLAPELLSMIDRDGQIGIEAAWAAATLLGPEAREPIATRLQSETDFETRVELTCVLVLLGDDPAAHDDLQTFGRLLTAQRLRGRALTSQQNANTPQQYDDWGDPIVNTVGDGDDSLAQSDLGLLYQAVVQLPGQMPTLARLDFATTDQTRGPRPSGTLPALEKQPTATLTESDGDALTLDGLPTHQLPIAELVGADAPMFAKLPRSEQNLFALTFNQFSTQSDDDDALREHWRAWLAEHGGADLNTMWRLGLESAVGDLTAEHWWNRMIAVARIERLTGRAIESPALFEAEQWAALQQRWQGWLDEDNLASPRAAMVTSAILSKHTDADLASAIVAGDDPAYLDLLVTLAGWGDLAQSRAALHQLNHWPDGPALLRAAARWQTAPRPELRAWYLNHAATTPRLYVHADELTPD